ncbi:MAG: cytochrome c peroxidase [Bacteroidota bacterium]|nr:cytochrome c peroxidase [Bacteroidota bacterium]
MNIFKILIFAVAILFIAGTASAQSLTPKEALGKAIFFDSNLSTPTGQSCASCHSPETGFTGPSSEINSTTVVYPGAIPTRFGNRKPPTAAYGGKSPIMYKKLKDNLFIGGMFWDGRATGWELGDPLAEQARGPFLNPVEQNNASKEVVINKIQNSDYATLFTQVYGHNAFDNIEMAYNQVADAVATYERSAEVNPFTSKFDYHLQGKVKLTKQEKNGEQIFNSSGKCANCHISKRHDKNTPPLFTDFSYDNLGMPKNPDNPFYTQLPEINPDGVNWIDKGLGGFLETVPQYSQYAAENYGKHKVPTLRNVDKRPYEGFVKSYGHNGFFKSLKDIVHFYNTRDVGMWPPPEVPMNVNTAELGNLGLSSENEDAIVAFLKTLSDGYMLPLARNSIADGSPTNFGLLQNTPNPFNPSTQIRYELPIAGYVTLKVYNTLGQEIATLVDGVQEAGFKSVLFDASNLPSGMYFARLVADGLTQTRKMLLLK